MSIVGVNKIELLRELWTAQKPASFFSYYPEAKVPKFDDAEAAEAIKAYIDYFQGRCIKTDISRDTASARMYDRDAGQGAFAKAVAAAKASVTITRRVEVICSFSELEQIVLTINFVEPVPQITEKLFLGRVYDALEEDERPLLVKLSCCQKCMHDEETILPFLGKRNGKYYADDLRCVISGAIARHEAAQ